MNRDSPAPDMAKQSRKSVSQGAAIAALLLNVLIFPGLGTVIWGKASTGVWQLVLAIISIPLMLIIVGIPLFIGIWIWALVSGVQLIKRAR